MDCNKCKNKTCLEMGKPCKEMEKFLRDQGIYDSDYIRPRVSSNDRGKGDSPYREIPFSSLPYDVQKKLGIDQEFYNYNCSPKEEENYK